MIKQLFVFILFLVVNINPADAQEVRAGGGLNYGTVIKNAGVNIRADVRIDPRWSIVPHFNWFIGKERYGIKSQWRAINLDAHYIFKIDDSWMIFPLLGFNIATVSEKVQDIKFSDTEIGINFGFGSEYALSDRLTGFGEVKYVFGDADQTVFTFGLHYLVIPQ